ncbi:MAG: hypothetical protein QM783_13270 [Phycisphaerales bacterium]
MQHDLDRRFLLGGLAGAAGVSALAAMAKGGPITPPAGAVASTGKPLSDVEPRTAINATNTPAANGFTHVISTNGSYYLTADVIATGGSNGILINAPRVTLDLNGFSVVNSSTGLFGILLNGNDQNAVIRNGSISSWGQIGIGHNGGTAPAIHLENLFLRNCVRGIRVTGPLRVTQCTAPTAPPSASSA